MKRDLFRLLIYSALHYRPVSTWNYDVRLCVESVGNVTRFGEIHPPGRQGTKLSHRRQSGTNRVPQKSVWSLYINIIYL